MKIAIFGRKFDQSFAKYIHTFLEVLSKYQCDIYMYQPFFEFISGICSTNIQCKGVFDEEHEINSDIKFMFSFGGDGTFLESANLVRDKGIPIIGINTGRLGFLANISKEEIQQYVEQLFGNQYYIVDRHLLYYESSPNPFLNFPYALNEVSIQKKGTSIITIHVYVDDQYMNTYWTDGLIVSSPTGSTAYSMSVGGPIVAPDCPVFIVSPIASHNLSVRPLIILNTCKLMIDVESRDQKFLATLDSQSYEIEQNTRISIKLANFTLKMVHFKGHDFFSTIRNKLLWGIDKRN